MIEEIMKHAPKGATHWQAGVYYKENDYGVWSMWKGYWESAFKWPDGFMTPLNEVSMFKEFFAGNVLVDMRDDKSGLHKVEIGTSPQTKCVKIFSSDMSHSYWVYSGYYRIAEKEEIAAGHRIDNDMGDDSHIENHISKNCKVIEHEAK